MICSNWFLEKQLPLTVLSQVALTGRHCKIHSNVMTRFDTKSIAMATYNGVLNVLVTGMRERKRQMEIFVHIKVANV